MDRTKAVLESIRSMLASMDMQGLFVSARTTREAMAEIERLRTDLDAVCRAVWELPPGEENNATLEETLDEIHRCNRLDVLTGDAGEG